MRKNGIVGKMLTYLDVWLAYTLYTYSNRIRIYNITLVLALPPLLALPLPFRLPQCPLPNILMHDPIPLQHKLPHWSTRRPIHNRPLHEAMAPPRRACKRNTLASTASADLP